jgi:glutathione S-transferase
MKLHQARASNPLRVMIYLRQKGIELERVEVNLEGGEQRSPAYLARNPAGKVPVLELDDGTFLPESGAIIEYLEELYPDPPMIGTTPAGRARVRSTERVMADLYPRLALYFQQSQAVIAKARGLKQFPVVAEAIVPEISDHFRLLDEYNAGREFLASDQVTVADCTAFPALQQARERFGYRIPAEFGRVNAWYERFSHHLGPAFGL